MTAPRRAAVALAATPRLTAPDRDVLRRLHAKSVRTYTVTERHLASLIDLIALGYAYAYEIDGGIWIAITDKGRDAAGLHRPDAKP